MKFAVDTNIMVYAEGVNGATSEAAARELVGQLPEESGFAPVQALAELYNVLTRKAGWAADRARNTVLGWSDMLTPAPTSASAILGAIDLAADHRLRIWDSIIISVASENGCRLLLSEDMQDGFTWGGVTVVNPFAVQQHPLLASLISNAANHHQ